MSRRRTVAREKQLPRPVNVDEVIDCIWHNELDRDPAAAYLREYLLEHGVTVALPPEQRKAARR